MSFIMQIRLLDARENDLWDSFAASRGALFYDTRVWEETLTRAFPAIRNHKFVIADEGRITAGLSLYETPFGLRGRKLTNAPFRFATTAYLEPSDRFTRMIGKVVDHAEKSAIDCIELVLPTDTFHSLLAAYEFTAMQQHYYPVVPLHESYEGTVRAYKARFRSKIRKLARELDHAEGFSFGETLTIDGLRDFHRLLVHQTKKKHRNLPPPFRLFETLWQASRSAGDLRLYQLTFRGRMIAGDLMFYHQGVAYFLWGAVDLRFEGISAGTYLLDRIIRAVYQDNMQLKQLDLGLTGPQNSGLVHYKSRMGSQFVRPWIYRRSLTKRQGSSAQMSRRARINALVRPVIPYLPVRAVKKLSEMFYPLLA